MNLHAEVDAFHPSDNTETVSAGAELRWREIWALRAGYQDIGRTDAEGGLCLGGGLQHELGGLDLQLDYAWTDFGRLDDASRLTLVVMF
jgi:hypothetical protein